MMVFDFNNRHLTALLVIMIPNQLISIIGQQIGIIVLALTNSYYQTHLLRLTYHNFIIHGVPLLLGCYNLIIKKNEGVSWNLFRKVIIIYALWCYVLDFRYTNPETVFLFNLYLFIVISLSLGFTYFLNKKPKIES